MRNPVTCWPGIGNQRTFEEFLTELLTDELFYPIAIQARAVHLVGSCIDDTFFTASAPGSHRGSFDERLVFWGCGMRSPTGLSEQNRSRCEFFAVAGPLTRSALRLGDSVPFGDPALLLPALYEPNRDPRISGQTLCIPNVLDRRSDAELLQLGGCSVVLRPSLPRSRQPSLRIIDAIASADFVLSASLHGAIIAAAYGRPFAYWNPGNLDEPFEWADFSASVSIENRFAARLEEARDVYASVIAPRLRLPPLWPLIASAPLAVRPDAALKVLAYEWRGRSIDAGDIRGAVSTLLEGQRAVGRRSGYRAPSHNAEAWSVSAITSALEESERLSAGNVQLRRELEDRTRELKDRTEEAERLTREIAAVAGRAPSETEAGVTALDRDSADVREEIMGSFAAHLFHAMRDIVAWIRKKNRTRLARRHGRPLEVRTSPLRHGGRGVIAWIREKNHARLARRQGCDPAARRGRLRHDAQYGEAVPAKRLIPPPLGPRVANRLGPRVLFIDTIYPRPDCDSGSVTARYLIDLFLEFGWQVSFFADGERNADTHYVRALEAAGVRCLRPSEARDLERFLRAEGTSFALCMLFRVHSGGRHYETVRRHCPDAKVVFETVDLHFLREERHARLEGDRRAVNVALGVRERELYVARSSDLAIVVSDFEHQLIERGVPGVRAMTLPLILECPGRTTPFSARSGVCFIGSYLHQPNVDAVTYFLDEIWPRVLERLPSCVFHIVGSDMPDEFRARATANVVPVGHVRDLDTFLDKMRLTVAPLRYGAGVKGKIGSSLANALPCVASPIAAEGMGLAIGEAIAVAESPAEFAERIASLHENEVDWTNMSDAGWRYVSEQYSLDAARKRIAGMLRQLDLPIPSPPAEDAALSPARRASHS